MRFVLRALVCFAVAMTMQSADAQGMSYGRAPRPNPEPSLPESVKVTQKLGDTIPVDLVFHDHDGKEIALKDCIGGKPTILVLAYFSCPKLCTEVLNGLVEEMKPLLRLGLRAGKDFNVVTVSINPKDGPAFARMKRLSYLEAYDHRHESEPGWWFLTASHGQGTNLLEAYEKITTLANSVGFGYVADNVKAYEQAAAESDSDKARVKLDTAIRKSKDFLHPSVIMVLTPDGRLSQYFHGLPRSAGGTDIESGYTAEDLRTALSAANGGSIGTMLQRMAINCFAYDDLSATYKLNMNILRWVAGPFVLLTAAFVLRTVWRARRDRRILTPALTEAPQ
jgi:protein SCO1